MFSAEAVDELLSRRGLRTPFLRLAKNGRIVPAQRFTGSGGAGAQISDQVLDDSVLRLFADGSTVVLQGLHRTWPAVGELAAGLADELGHPVQVNAYITPPQSQGFAAHYDTHDVFVLQIAGVKAWHVHEPVVSAPLAELPWETQADAVAARAQEQPLVEAVMQPGDSLYLPRGFIHSAQALGGVSIHLTFGIHPVVERDVLRAALKALEATGWRASLPAGWDPLSPEGGTQLKALLADIADAITGIEPADLGEILHDKAVALQRPTPVGPLAQLSASNALTPDDVVQLRAHLGVRPDGDEWVLPGGRRIDLVGADPAALSQLLGGFGVPVRHLHVALQEAVELGRRLMIEGILVVAADPTP